MNALSVIDVIDTERLPELLIGLCFNAMAISSLALLTFRRSRSRAVSIFTLVVVNIVVFFVTYVMASAAAGDSSAIGGQSVRDRRQSVT